MPATEDATALRKKLRGHGYAPLPVNGKVPVLEEWEKQTKTNDDEIELWGSLFPYAANTGVITRTTPGLDIDLLDEAAAVAIEDLAKERFGDRGRFLVRIGRPPKRLIPLRTAAPFKKITLNLIAGNDRTGDKIEILSDGQQMVVAGKHPDTKKPYRWFGGALWDVAAGELPLVTEAEMRAFVVAAGELLVADFGYRVMGAGNGGADDITAAIEGGRDWTDCIAGILSGEALHDNIAVLAAKQIACGVAAGVIVNFIRNLMERSQAPHDARWQERYDDIPRAITTAQQKFARPGAPDDDHEIERLARMPRLEYERARKAAAEKLGIMRLSALDAEVADKRAELGLDAEDDGKQGRAIEFPEPLPWDQSVDGAELLGALVDILGRYVVMTEPQKVAIALWLVHACLIDRSMISPRLAVRSPIKGCGKTTLLDVLTRLVPRPLATANVSPSAIFRVIAAHRPTLLIDEADTLFRDGDETLRGILNAGHRRGGTVLRSVGDEHEPRAFACYAATVIALIGQLPGTLADRSVDIVLARRRPNEPITPFRLDKTESLDVLARQTARWAKDNSERIGVTDPEVPPGIYNRAADNLRPLLAIAEAVGGEWAEKARKAAVILVGGDIDEVSRTELLLSDIRTIFTALGVDEISSANLIERLCEIVPRPWSEMDKPPKPMTQNKLARLLKPLAIPPELITDRRIAGYRLARFDEAFERYLAPQGVSNLSPSPNPITTGVSDLFATSQPKNSGEVSKSQKSNNDGPMRGGEVAKGENGHAEPLGLSERAIEGYADRIQRHAADHVDDADLTAATERILRRWLAEDGVLPEHIAAEARRVMDAVFNRPI